MKTIFVTSFEGVETKNVLRTPILKTLLNANTRVVLFTKDYDRMNYHKREFTDPRISYEVVGAIPVTGIDRLFQHVKFILLRTDTTDLRRKMKLDKDRHYASYGVSILINRLVARSWIRRIARMLDYAIVKNHSYDIFFERYNPDIVFCSNLFNEPEVHFLRAARRHGVPTVGFINSWDKVTARCILRLLPDKLIVFNDMVRDDVMRYDDMLSQGIFVAGVPQYDHYFEAPVTSREDFFKRIGIDPKNKLIVYAPMGGTFSTSDWDIVDMINDAIKKKEFGDQIEMLVRFPPNEILDQKELQKRPYLHYDYPGIRFSLIRGVDWDMSFTELQHLADTLQNMSLLICYASSMSVDAAVFDKPVININFEVKEKELLVKSPTQFYKMTHYQKALASGGIRLVNSKEECIKWINTYLVNPSVDQEGRKRLVEEQCQFTDGKSGERIGNFILSHIKK